MENLIKMDDLGVPLFSETPIFIGWPNAYPKYVGILYWISFAPSRSYPTGERLSGVGDVYSPKRCPVVALWTIILKPPQTLSQTYSSLIIFPDQKKPLTKKHLHQSTKAQKSWQLMHDIHLLCLHPWKLTCPLKSDHFSRGYIFQPSIFRGHVSFQGSIPLGRPSSQYKWQSEVCRNSLTKTCQNRWRFIGMGQ